MRIGRLGKRFFALGLVVILALPGAWAQDEEDEEDQGPTNPPSAEITVSCFSPGSGEVSADYIGGKGVWRSYLLRGFGVKTWSKEGKGGATFDFLEPAQSAKNLKKLQKAAALSRKFIARRTKPPQFMADPKDPALIQSQYVFEADVQSKDKKHFVPGGWTFELVFSLGEKEIVRNPQVEWLDETPRLVKQAASVPLGTFALGGGFSVGGGIPLGKSVKGMACRLYSGVKYNPKIPVVTVRATRLDGLSFEGKFHIRYGELPAVIEVPRPGGKGISREWTWTPSKP